LRFGINAATRFKEINNFEIATPAFKHAGAGYDVSRVFQQPVEVLYRSFFSASHSVKDAPALPAPLIRLSFFREEKTIHRLNSLTLSHVTCSPAARGVLS
jgi:hypothetical protein